MFKITKMRTLVQASIFLVYFFVKPIKKRLDLLVAHFNVFKSVSAIILPKFIIK